MTWVDKFALLIRHVSEDRDTTAARDGDARHLS